MAQAGARVGPSTVEPHFIQLRPLAEPVTVPVAHFGRERCQYGARTRSGYPRFHTGGPMSTLTHSPAWQALTRHAESMRDVQVRDLFAAASARFNDFSLEVDDLLVDFSKNRITADTLSLLFALARQEEIFTW